MKGVVVVWVVLALTGTAAADGPPRESFAIAYGLESLPVAFGVAAAITGGEPEELPALEVATGLLGAALNGWVVYSSCKGCGLVASPVLVGFTALDLAAAIHGVYLLERTKPAAASAPVRVGSIRGTLRPTVVTDSSAVAPGLALAGTF